MQSLAKRAKNSDFVRHGLLVFAALMAANVLQLVFYSFVSRVVGVEQYGVLTSLFSAILLLAVGPATVAGTIVARLAADLAAVGDFAKLRRLGDLITTTTGIIGFAAFGIVELLARPVANYLHVQSTAPITFTGIALGLSFAIPVQRGVFQGTERFGAFAASNLVEATAKVVAGPLLGIRFGLNGVLLGLCLASCFAWCYNVWTLRRFEPTPGRLSLDLRRLAITSTQVAIAIFAVNALLFYDVILVRHYFSAMTAGLYGAAALVGRAVYTIIAFVPTIVLPKASARRNAGRRTRPLLIGALLTSAVIIAVAIIVCRFAPDLVILILAGHAFAAAAAYEVPYVFALGALALTNVVAMYKIGLHRFSFVLPLALVASVEIVTATLWHPSIGAVLTVLCVGHSLALGTALYRVRAATPVILRMAEGFEHRVQP